MVMKKIGILSLIVLLFAGCGINRQIGNLKAFEKCRYDLISADSIYVANINASNLMGESGLDLKKTPRLALAILRKDVPLRARLNLSIENPSPDLAAINQFEYKILIKNRELATGFVNQEIAVNPSDKVTVPIQLNANVYNLLTDQKIQDAIADFVTDDSGKKKGVVTIKIKPTLGTGNRKIKYPGYITIDKEISSKILL